MNSLPDMTMIERRRAFRFERRHALCYRKQGRNRCIRYTFLSTGVGVKVTVACRNCKKKRDISDYEAW